MQTQNLIYITYYEKLSYLHNLVRMLWEQFRIDTFGKSPWLIP